MFPTNPEMVARFYELCDQRDALYAKAQPLEDELDKANVECEQARLRAEKIASQIDTVLGRDKFLALKREIAQIARYLGKIPARAAPATKK